MSRASKITLISSIIFTTTTIGLVFWLKDSEEQARRVGLNKMAQERSKQRIENEADLIYQEELRKRLEKDQAVSLMERVIVPNSVANRIITVGEPSRARKIAKYFDNTQPIIEVESKRGFLTLTGTYKNEKVSIIAIGMGLGVADMLVREVRAVTNGPLLIIRFGSCGGIGTAGDAGMVSVCKEGAVLVTKNYDYWVQDYHYESEDEAEADSPLGKIFDTGYGVVTKAFHDTFRGIPYHISAVIPADLQLSTHLYYYLQEHVGVDNTCTGINATADSFYSSQGRTGDVFGDDNEKLISAIRKKLPFAETLEMESGMILHLAQCATFESKKNPNHPGPIRATACAMIFFNRNTTEAIDHDLIDELEKNAGRACLDAIVETAF